MSIERALVLAGSRKAADPVAAYAGVSQKALIPLAGSPLLARVLSALRAAGVARICVVASHPDVVALAAAEGAETLPAEAGPSASVRRGVEALGTPLLITTCDHALLQASWIEQFVADAPADADICVLLAPRQAVEAAAPGAQRTYLRFSDGEWSGCNLFLARTDRARAAIDLWSQVEADRKKPWRIVRRLGPLTLLRYVLGRLSLAQALARFGRLCGVRAAAVISPFGLAAVDVDKPADLDLVRSIAEP